MSADDPIRRALLSVTDKRGLAELGAALVERDVELVGSGGSARHLRDAGLDVTPVEELTRFPEMLDGRVKTLHPALHAALLADRGKASHRADLATHAIRPIDLVVVNFYAFERAAAAAELPLEAIDIGGPALGRAAAKNFEWVTVLTDPEDYQEFLEVWGAGRIDRDFRRRMAARAFERVAAYDAAIAARFAHLTSAVAAAPSRRPLHCAGSLRYGENPHQEAAAWVEEPAWGLGALRQVSGGELSYNNLADADAAVDLAYDLGERPACVLVKHNNPCGVALGATVAEAFRLAQACDPVAAFGAVVAFNFTVDAQAAEAIAGQFLEVLCAPAIAPVARERLAARKKRLRILEVPRETWMPRPAPRIERALHGMVLVQGRDLGFDEMSDLEVVTQRRPTDEEREDAVFLMAVCKHVRSNAIVVGRERRTLGIGAGQMSRVDSCDLAVRKAIAAAHDLQGAAAASDAFFPFADGVEHLAAAGVQVILQPGGSKRDGEVVAAADRLGICMLLSGRRHFRH
ncbi:MAG: bifunctional phosphoribosylaminoimidazolecarboxamide formyltransferase/IMP cyclohydrolase [Candidatus Krumholzibacteriia bacterium]